MVGPAMWLREPRRSKNSCNRRVCLLKWSQATHKRLLMRRPRKGDTTRPRAHYYWNCCRKPMTKERRQRDVLNSIYVYALNKRVDCIHFWLMDYQCRGQISRDAALQGGDPRMSKPNGPRQESKTRQREQRPVVSIVVNPTPLYTHAVPDSGYFRVTITFLRVCVCVLPFHCLWADNKTAVKKRVRVATTMVNLPHTYITHT